MNNYTYEEINIGDKHSFKKFISNDMVQKFKEITKDINPLHNDKEFAQKKGFKDTVVYGLLTSSFSQQ